MFDSKLVKCWLISRNSPIWTLKHVLWKYYSYSYLPRSLSALNTFDFGGWRSGKSPHLATMKVPDEMRWVEYNLSLWSGLFWWDRESSALTVYVVGSIDEKHPVGKNSMRSLFFGGDHPSKEDSEGVHWFFILMKKPISKHFTAYTQSSSLYSHSLITFRLEISLVFSLPAWYLGYS
jgi:hypothetical protein